MDKKIINDQKKTIERLQQECIEKTNAIIKLDEKNEKLEKRVEISGETIDKVIEALYPNADEDELFAIAFNGEWIDDLKERLAKLSIKEQECEELKAELKNFQDMAKKGLDELKDVGGCWGCGLQLQLNQNIQDIKQLKSENEELKEKINRLLDERNKYLDNWGINLIYKQTLAEIKEIAENGKRFAERYMITGEQKANVLTYANTILQKISEVIQ